VSEYERRHYHSSIGGFSRSRLVLVAGALLIALGAGLGVWLATGSSSSKAAKPTDDPVAFLRGVVRKLAANDYDGAWLTLHPAQQRVATRTVYVHCEQLSPIPGHLDSIKLVGTEDERITVPGDSGVVDSKVARFLLTISEPVLKERVPVRVTAHAVAVDGRWRWILPAARFAPYRANTCPGFGTPTSGA
jgi:hypothetical protein